MNAFVHLLIVLAVLGSGIVAGIFFAFSTFVMKALARLPVPQGIAAMQQINMAVLNLMFGCVFAGTAAVGLLASVLVIVSRSAVGSVWLAAGTILYGAGVILVTLKRNVPLNNMLNALDTGSRQITDAWNHYINEWSLWNHIRTLAAAASTICFLLSL